MTINEKIQTAEQRINELQLLINHWNACNGLDSIKDSKVVRLEKAKETKTCAA
ncbi:MULTISPECIES: hypothetical protein [Prochlorococcus]|uniref:hypothetical protein n=1 Tax=Prochlorococcus TaxID=1218 RepID=UPI000533A5A5|nr:MULTISPECIES: hypothetical protein [Prochlorococcus]KGG12537.1 hypothetical protein EV05_1749 [Prochlorococcus sp. MIT 0601]